MIEAINEALELLRIAQSGMGPDPGYLDRYDRHHWDRISKCREGLEKLRQQEPVEFWLCEGCGHYHNGCVTSCDCLTGAVIRKVSLYAAPVPAAVPDGWKLVPVEATDAMLKAAHMESRFARRAGVEPAQQDYYRAMLSAAPAAPAATADVAKDAERYRWLRDRLAIEDIDRLVSEFFGTPDEAESAKTDAAIDAAMQKGGE